MPDYNIYLHAEFGGSGSKTKPFDSSKSSATSTKDSGGNGETVASIINTISNPDSLVAKGVSTVAKAVPYVLVAMAVIGLVDKTVSTVQQFQAINSGNYYYMTQYNNFKTTLKAAFRPFSTTLNFIKYQEEMRVQKERLQLNQELLGDSIINSRSTGRMV